MMRATTPTESIGLDGDNTESVKRYHRGAVVEEFEMRVIRSVTGREVRLPVPVTVRRTADYVAVVEPVTGIHGVGSDPKSALRDFWVALAEWDTAVGSAPDAPNLRQMRAVLDLLLNA